jgi:small subunit ribosomal protein S20
VANIKQQIKRNRRALKQRETNLRYRSTIKTLYKRLDAAVSAGEGDADERSRGLVRLIDRAAARGVIHKNSAARKKRRIARLMNRASETSGAAG